MQSTTSIEELRRFMTGKILFTPSPKGTVVYQFGTTHLIIQGQDGQIISTYDLVDRDGQPYIHTSERIFGTDQFYHFQLVSNKEPIEIRIYTEKLKEIVVLKSTT